MAVAAICIHAGLGLASLIQREKRVLAEIELLRLVQFARAQAVNLQQQVTLCSFNKAGKCQIRWDDSDVAIFVDKNHNRRVDADEALLVSRWPGERGSLAWRASLGRPYLEFDGMGATTQNGSFILCYREDAVRPDLVLTLNRGGRPYVNKPGRRRCPPGPG